MQNSSFKISAAVPGSGALLKISAVAVAVVMLGAGATANAGSLGKPCTSAPEAQWLPMPQLQAKVEAQGYKVQKAKLKNACGELYTLDKNGSRVELFVDPTNGQIIGQM
ncbi:PepSY domain-containing protein [Bradyrhizobium sp. 1050_B9_N1_2]|uniref:PepSY domain-containing protein n=1 Tax=Bradyrhizobium sp. 1050_B9_N1_2 TaxID=3238688 RepID=UPI003EDBBF7B